MIKDLFDEVYINAQKILLENLSSDELTLFVFERKGIERKLATFATAKLEVVGNAFLHKGDMFATVDDIKYEVTHDVQITGTGLVNVICLVPGAVGNVSANSITQMPISLVGVTSVTNTMSSYGGYNEETDENLLQRYYTALQTPATSGNIYHYKLWALECQGVGDCTVYPLDNGDNTVTIMIVDYNNNPVAQDLIDIVQSYIDPNINGDGSGQAPIGAKCTIISALPTTIDVTVSLIIDAAHDMEQVKSDVKISIMEYINSITLDVGIVSYAQISKAILNTVSVVDFNNLRVNSTMGNIPIPQRHTPVLGEMLYV